MKLDTILENKSLKLTSARKELLEILSVEARPISFDDIKDKITMDKATFYRNISKFENESIVKGFESNDKKRCYEIQNSPHAHFICNRCNYIECLKDTSFLKLEGHKVIDTIFKGICKECNQQ